MDDLVLADLFAESAFGGLPSVEGQAMWVEDWMRSSSCSEAGSA